MGRTHRRLTVRRPAIAHARSGSASSIAAAWNVSAAHATMASVRAMACALSQFAMARCATLMAPEAATPSATATSKLTSGCENVEAERCTLPGVKRARAISMLTENATMVRTSLTMMTVRTRVQNGPLPPVSCRTAMAEAGDLAIISVPGYLEKDPPSQ
jgi:hypothetical protein